MWDSYEDPSNDPDEIDDIAVWMRQVSQTNANYDPIGGMSGGGKKACANCNWFIAGSGSCVTVSGEISPTGLSDLWLAQQTYEMEPLKVVIVGGTAELGPVKVVAGTKRAFSAAERDKLAKSGAAKSDGSYPIETAGDVANAVKDFGRANGSASDKAHIVARAKAIGATDKLPDGWTSGSKELSWPNWLKSIGAKFGGQQAPGQVVVPFQVKAMPDGRLRYFLWATNCFTDRTDETFTTASHKEFVDWCDTSGNYPELWLWHIPGSKVGQADWVCESNGFRLTSGLIDPAREALVQKFAEGGELSVSHGYFGVKEIDTGTLNLYRSWEDSILPRGREANPFTAFSMEEVKNMAFTAAKKDWLKSAGVDDTTITQWETQTKELGDKLKAMGFAWKAAGDVEEPDPEPKPEPVPTPEGSQVIAAVASMTEALAGVTTLVAEMRARQDTFETNYNKAVENAFAGAIGQMPRGFQASASTKNIDDSKSGDPTSSAGAGDPDFSWFGGVVGGALGIAPKAPDTVANGAAGA